MPTSISPACLLQELIRFDTTNPPGNEAACIGHLDGVLRTTGITTTLLAKDPDRPNLIARLPGAGHAPPLLLQGHVDVVTTVGQTWTHPPFAGIERDGYIWGRGALDMKSGVTMMTCALLQLKAAGITPRGDVILCALSDEEAGGRYGARYLVEEHPEQFAGVKHALGELGGFPMSIGGVRFYPIQVAEKVQCALRLTLRGPAGHGSMPIRGGAMARLGRVLRALDRRPLPTHITPVAQTMLAGMAAATRSPVRQVLRLLLSPRLSSAVIAGLGARLDMVAPLLRNTVSPTIVRGGAAINVIPGEITLDLDGRMLPGVAVEQMVAEVRAIVGRDVTIDVLHADPSATAAPDWSQFAMLANILRELDPDGVPLPYLLPGVSDARFFRRLGIQTYGFTPMNLPADFNFRATIHAADERIPVAALDFGTRAIRSVLERYGT